VERQARTTIVIESGVEKICSKESSEAEGNTGEGDMNNPKVGTTENTALCSMAASEALIHGKSGRAVCS
jgi:hypothetical protein